MQLSRIESYARKLGAMLEQVDTLSQETDKLAAYLHLATELDENDKAMQLANKHAELTETLERITQITLDFANRSDVESASRLFADLSIRLQNASKLFEDNRRVEASYELSTAVEAFSPEERAEAQETLSLTKLRYEKQIELAGNLVPAVSTTLDIVRAI